MEVYQGTQRSVKESVELVNPTSVELVNPEVLIARAGEGLLQLSVELGLDVLRQMLETDAITLAGAKGKHQQGRQAYRHGVEKSRVVLGGEKVPVERPRVRSVEGTELPLPTLGLFQREYPLNAALLSRLPPCPN